MENTGKVIAAFLAGAAAGASLGLLLAPDKGDDTRKKVKDALDEWTEKAGEQYQKYRKGSEEK